MTESGRTDRRKKYSLKMIRQAFLELLKEKELSSITVTEVCRLADVNRGTFYKYYCDIDDLFQQTCNAFLNELSTLIICSYEEKNSGNIVLADKDNIEKNFYELLDNALEIVSQNHDLLLILRKTNSFHVIASQLVSHIDSVVSVQLRKLSPELSEQEVAYMVKFIVGGCGAIVEQWHSDGMVMPREQLIRMIYKAINGILDEYR